MIITDIIPFVQAQIKLCPLPMVYAETHWAAKKFIEDTRAWTFKVKDVLLEPKVMKYDMTVPRDTKVSNVYGVWLVEHDEDGNETARRQLSGVRGDSLGDPSTRHQATYALPSFWTYQNDKMIVWPVGDIDRQFTLEADVCLTIDGKAPVLPDWVDEHDVAYGALSRLYGLAGQDWFSADLANYYEDKFEKAIAAKRIERIHGGMAGSMTIQAPQFGGYF